MVKVYFGPYKHSPAPELQHDERRLMFYDFGLLKGIDSDFWTNNPLILDEFDPGQIYLWHDEKWVTLTETADRLLPHRHTDDEPKGMCPGRLALMCELVYHFGAFREANPDKPPQ